MECRAARGAEEDGDGRLQSPWRSSMDRLQGESIDETSPPVSDCSPSNLNTQTSVVVVVNNNNNNNNNNNTPVIHMSGRGGER